MSCTKATYDQRLYIETGDLKTYLVCNEIKHEQWCTKIVCEEGLSRPRTAEWEYAQIELATKDEQDYRETQVPVKQVNTCLEYSLEVTLTGRKEPPEL